MIPCQVPPEQAYSEKLPDPGFVFEYRAPGVLHVLVRPIVPTPHVGTALVWKLWQVGAP